MTDSKPANRFYVLLWPIISGLLAALLLILFLNQSLNSSAKQNFSHSTNHSKNTHTTIASFAPAVERSAPAVVNIFTRQTLKPSALQNQQSQDVLLGTQPQANDNSLDGLGSGVIMNPQGFILTNYHVIKDADDILIQLQDKRRSRARIIGLDPETDLAVLKIELENLPVIAELSDEVSVGDIALAIGNPLGLGQTVTMGIISATGRSNLGLYTYEDFIQTDAAINRGNSGGALIDTQGRLIGINSVIFSRSGGSDGIGFTIPARVALEVLNEIIAKGRVVRGWLGADFQKLNLELAKFLNTNKTNGVVILKVLNNGPAFRGGLKVKDLIISINGLSIIHENDALSAIAKVKPGNSAQLEVIREGKLLNLDIVVGERPLVL